MLPMLRRRRRQPRRRVDTRAAIATLTKNDERRTHFGRILSVASKSPMLSENTRLKLRIPNANLESCILFLTFIPQAIVFAQ